MQILDCRISSTLGNQRLYLKFSKEIYEYLVDRCNDLRESYFYNIDKNRNKLKNKELIHIV
jgi:hypothetical protein